MSSPAPVTADIYRWADGALHLLDYCDMTDASIEIADSWLVSDGKTVGLELHRQRFLAVGGLDTLDHRTAFWDAALALIPREGGWFPRVELHSGPRMLFRLRSAPPRTQSLTVTTHRGPDPRTHPSVKGPDLDALRRVRATAQAAGADEAVILSVDGYVVEGAYSSLVWWRGAILCSPPDEFERVDSVTSRSLITLARALGVDTHTEAVTPAELDGCEVWALNALQGPRIVTKWIDGPEMAELPGRLALWRGRLNALAHELP